MGDFFKEIFRMIQKPKSSEVLSTYLKQTKLPPWTSYFVKVKNFE